MKFHFDPMRVKKKVCFKCGTEKPLSHFYAHPKMADGHLNKCKECSKSDVQSNYQKNKGHYKRYDKERESDPERKAKKLVYQRTTRANHPGKANARRKVHRAIKSGWLDKLPCKVCGDPNSQAHHHDYTKPLEVEWLCQTHHTQEHI